MGSTMVNYLIVILLVGSTLVVGRNIQQSEHDQKPSSSASISEFLSNGSDAGEGTRWAVLMAGSNGFWNYRHQSDVCHAYQVLKKGGLKDENIIVLMVDDIAANEENPHPGVIINRPNGENVYKGVKIDYRDDSVTVENFLNVLRGNESGVTGGTGKVLKSGPNDHVFVYYSDHGGSGMLGTPNGNLLYAIDIIKTLKEKHAKNEYKSMVVYIEACESGSIFDGLLPKGLNIYATTAANSVESSYGAYCDTEVDSCLGDVYSISWTEDTERHDRRKETLEKQYESVKNRTLRPDEEMSSIGSHVMQFGDLKLGERDHLDMFMGARNSNNTSYHFKRLTTAKDSIKSKMSVVEQRDADLVYFRRKLQKAPAGSEAQLKAHKRLTKILESRDHIDLSIRKIGEQLISTTNNPELMLFAARPAGSPIVDDWDCLKSMVNKFELHCGSLSQYGLKHGRFFANMCNAGIKPNQMAEIASKTCSE